MHCTGQTITIQHHAEVECGLHTASFQSRSSDKASVRIWLRPLTMSWIHGIHRPSPRWLCARSGIRRLRRCYQNGWPPVYVVVFVYLVGPACAVVDLWYCDKTGIMLMNESWNDRDEKKRTPSGGRAWTPTAGVAATTFFSGHHRLNNRQQRASRDLCLPHTSPCSFVNTEIRSRIALRFVVRSQGVNVDCGKCTAVVRRLAVVVNLRATTVSFTAGEATAWTARRCRKLLPNVASVAVAEHPPFDTHQDTLSAALPQVS